MRAMLHRLQSPCVRHAPRRHKDHGYSRGIGRPHPTKATALDRLDELIALTRLQLELAEKAERRSTRLIVVGVTLAPTPIVVDGCIGSAGCTSSALTTNLTTNEIALGQPESVWLDGQSSI